MGLEELKTEVEKLDEESRSAVMLLIQQYQLQYEELNTIIINGKDGVSHTARKRLFDPETNQMDEKSIKQLQGLRTFVWGVCTVLWKTQQWLPILYILENSFQIGDIDHVIEEFREAKNPRDMPLLLTAPALVKLMRTDHPDYRELKKGALEAISNSLVPLRGRFAIEFLKEGGRQLLLDIIHSGPAPMHFPCARMFQRMLLDDNIANPDKRLDNAINKTAQFAAKLDGKDIDENTLLQFTAFLNQEWKECAEEDNPVVVISFTKRILQLKHSKKTKEEYKSMVLAMELVRHCFEQGTSKFVELVSGVGLSFFLESVIEVMDLHDSLYKTMAANNSLFVL